MAMERFDLSTFSKGRAICYSGFREGQRPGGVYPDYKQIREDLLLLANHWKYLRLYDCDQHADTVLKVIRNENLGLSVMLGAYIEAEMNNFNCPWDGGVYTEEQLAKNRTGNKQKMQRLITLARLYPDIVCSLSVGNEACVDWTDHFVPESSVLEYVKMVKDEVHQPVTFCENYLPWLITLEKLAGAVDFISIHTYPVWEYKHISESLDHTRQNYEAVKNRYPGKEVIITEAGWATHSDGRGILPDNVSEEYQKIYFEKLMKWSENEHVPVFFFEAFDEEWKGSSNPLEPEKHWGLFNIDRSPKLAIKDLFQEQTSIK